MKTSITKFEAAIPQLLINNLRNRKAFLLMGSGVSMPLGYPSWGQLIEKLYNKYTETDNGDNLETANWLKANFKQCPDWAAELLKSMPGNFYEKSLSEIFGSFPKNPHSIVYSLAALLPFEGYITTNYETTIEDYLSEFLSEKPVVITHADIIGNNAVREDGMPVYKLHGCITKGCDGLILASSDYYMLLQNRMYIDFVDRLLSNNVILTIGFSLRDRDFRQFVENRKCIYKGKCEPMYVIVEDKETCRLEIDVYRKDYNIHLIPISGKNNFESLRIFMFGLYCLVYRIDSAKYGEEIRCLINDRLSRSGKFKVPQFEYDRGKIDKAEKLMSVFSEPVDMDVFTTICSDAGIELSPAHYRVISSICGDKISCRHKVSPSDYEIDAVSKWLSHHFDAIPLGETPRYLSVYYKRIFNEFSQTITFLLKNKKGWKNLVGDGTEENSKKKFERFNEYYKQEGKWVEWLNIVDKATAYVKVKTNLFADLMKTKAWIYFWTRRYGDLVKLLKEYPDVDDKKGQCNYTERMQYMDRRNLNKLITSLEGQHDLDYFRCSLLGRSYARKALSQKRNKDKFWEKSYKTLKCALSKAQKSNDLVEVSVQSWYLAIVCSKIGIHADEAEDYLAEVRRIDECILNRVPGIAWLKLAEYHLAKKKEGVPDEVISNLRDIAICKMRELGVSDPENYVDNEYLY